MADEVKINLTGILGKVQEKLKAHGIEIDLNGGLDICCEDGKGAKVKVVCVAPGVQDCVEEMGQAPRDQVVMVRVDEATLQELDSWVATGAVKSRSEAAALFIREGLKVRAGELARMRDALDEVDAAKARLRTQAKEVFGGGE